MIKNNVMEIQESHFLNLLDDSEKEKQVTTMAYPYTGLLDRHVRSINGRPIFYFEVKFVGKINEEKLFDLKNKDFSVGLSTGDFSGCKIVGDNKESIGLSGDGKVHFNDDTNVPKSIDVNNGQNFKFHTGFVLGVGFIFKTR